MYKKGLHIHFVGIGGAGMSGVAEILVNLGYRVSGSDLKNSPITNHLSEIGATIMFGHRSEHITPEVSAIVISSAVRSDNPEILEAQVRGIPIILRQEMLGELMRMKYGIAVAGSHGKTTTTSMIAKLLTDGALDPTVIVGGRVLTKRSGAQLGRGNYLVTESDESDGSMRFLRPVISVVTNIDHEHVGFYGSFGALEIAFSEFMAQVPFYGVVVACFDDPVVQRLAKQLSRRVISYGLSETFDYSLQSLVINQFETRYSLLVSGKLRGEVSLPMPGMHFALNSLAALIVGVELGLTIEECIKALASFPGVSRRSELVLDYQGIRLIDDYGHHPREVQTTLSALRRGLFVGKESGGRLIALFEPHRYSRIQELFFDFLTAFADASEVIVGEIYPAGEDPIPGVSGETLAQALQHPKVSFVGDLHQAIPGLLKTLAPGDVVVGLGAGNITKVIHELASTLKGE